MTADFSAEGGSPAQSFRSVPRTGVIFVMAEAAKKGFSYGAPGWVNLGQGAPEVGPLDGAPPRIAQVDVGTSAYEYAPVPGLWELREAVASLYNARYRRGLPSQYSAENVAISSGGRAGLTRIAAALGPIHLGHFLPDYTAYEELLEVFKAFVPIPIVLRRSEGYSISPDRLRSEVLGKGLGAILFSNPCNPTGQVVAGDELVLWVNICKKLGCALIVDEFYSHYLYGSVQEKCGPALSACRYVEDVDADPVVVLDGLTKNWRYPGWRLSWTVGPKAVIERIASAGSFLDGGPSHPLQRAALPLVRQEVADQEAKAIQKVFGAKRATLLRRAESMGLRISAAPEGAFYAFAGLDGLPEELRDGMDFFRAALDEKVIVVPGAFFDVNPGRRRGHLASRLRSTVRLSFGPKADAVEEGMSRLEAMVRRAS